MKHRFALALMATIALTPAAATPAPAAPPGHASITLTVADNGRHVWVRRGDDVLVWLSVDIRQNPDPATWWRPIDESGPALRARPQIALPVRGSTLGRFRAVARGEATLSSSRALCAPRTNGPVCHAIQGWGVTLHVR